MSVDIRNIISNKMNFSYCYNTVGFCKSSHIRIYVECIG